MNWFKRRSVQVDPDELMRKANESIAETRRQQPRVNFIATYLNERKDSNGFGEDFEYTLRPRPRGSARS